ncbi:MAG: hypothetical protein H7Y32_21475 [Chloroflexales bacterium]|nr:hypothetical protein [Chloroflexales bacterium]
MYFQHSTPIWQAFPQLVAGLLLVEGVDNPPHTALRLDPLFDRARARLASGPESDLPEVSAWRRAYSQMGMKPTQYRSAAEALLRRFRREDALPALHPLVDLCNAVSLAFALPVAVIDLAGVAGFIEVRHARGDEHYTSFSGEQEHPDPNEVIFADANNDVHARRWTFRQSRQSTVSAATRRALIVSEGLHARAAADVPALLDTLAAEITSLWPPPLGQQLLSAAEPRWDLPV